MVGHDESESSVTIHQNHRSQCPRIPTLVELTADIAANGLREPIKVFQGQIVDGRARLQACNDAKVEPRFEEAEIPNGNVKAFVISKNLHRRHLNDSQRAMIAAKLANLEVGANQHTTDAMTQKAAAEAFKVSVDTLQRAKKVNEVGVPALKDAVQAGKLDVTNAAVIASLPPEKQVEVVAMEPKAILAAAKKINKENKAVIRKKQLDHLIKLRKQNKPLHVDGQTFELICADPAWDYLGTLDTPYPTMPLAEILAMPVTQRAAKDAVLFLWVPASLVAEGLEVIKAWGFNYKTCAVWKKGESGTGGYFRVNHEMLMFATRGDVPTVAEGKRPVSCFEEAKREHSVKPEKAFEMIDAMYPELTKLELFCRGTPRQGWSGWGNECEGAIDADVDFAPTATDATGDQLDCTASAQSDGADLASQCGDTVAEVAVAANDEDIGDELIRAITPVTYHPPKRPAKAA